MSSSALTFCGGCHGNSSIEGILECMEFNHFCLAEDRVSRGLLGHSSVNRSTDPRANRRVHTVTHSCTWAHAHVHSGAVVKVWDERP